MKVVVVILAAGTSSRFGSPKLLATLDDRPILQHVVDAVRTAGLSETIVVLGAGGDEIDAAITWTGQRRVRNEDPGAGLSSSLRVGIGAVSADADAALILLGDQPRIRPATIAAVLEAAARRPDRPVIRAIHAGDAAPNPVLVRWTAFGLVDRASGDRGLGPFLADHPELVFDVAVSGDNPDVDTPGDLAAIVDPPPEEVVIRRARPDDAAELERLRRGLAAEDGSSADDATFAAGFAAFLRSALGGATWSIWVAEREDRLIGTAWVQLVARVPSPGDPAGPIAYVTNVFVEPEMRNAGRGTALLRAAVESAAAAGAELAIVWPSDRSDAFYRREGFEPPAGVLIRRFDRA